MEEDRNRELLLTVKETARLSGVSACARSTTMMRSACCGLPK